MQIRYIIAILIAASAFYSGWKISDWKNDSELKAKLEEQLKINAEIKAKVDLYEIHYFEEVTKSNAIEKEVIRYVTKVITKEDDSKCTINRGFVRLHNNSLRGEFTNPEESDGSPTGTALSEVGSIVSSNYFTCKREIEKLKALQAIINEHSKKQNERDKRKD